MKRKWSEIVREERNKGNVVFLAIDSVVSAPVDEIIKQPVDGLLWDLNRDEITALAFMDKEGMEHWVNNFAVALVIRELHKQLEILQAERDALVRYTRLLDRYGKFSDLPLVVTRKIGDARRALSEATRKEIEGSE